MVLPHGVGEYEKVLDGIALAIVCLRECLDSRRVVTREAED